MTKFFTRLSIIALVFAIVGQVFVSLKWTGQFDTAITYGTWLNWMIFWVSLAINYNIFLHRRNEIPTSGRWWKEFFRSLFPFKKK